MKLFLCLIALLLVDGSVAVEIPLSGQDRDLGEITKSGTRPLRIAIGGIPVAMVNKVGRSYKPPPNAINGFFPGLSAIVDSDRDCATVPATHLFVRVWASRS